MGRNAVLVVLAAALVAACGGASTSPPADGGPSSSPASSTASDPSVIPVIVSSQQVVGPNRFLFSFLDPDTNQPAARPERTASVAFIGPGESQPGAATPATFVWAVEGTTGTYVANVEFPTEGDWTAVFVTAAPGAAQEAIAVGFQVQPDGIVVAVGERAPASKTPTAADVGGDLARLSTDAQPDPAFYQLSVDGALAQERPFVLVFATPAFCQSAQCGPTLDRVKSVAKTAPGISFINVEPYRLEYTEGRLQPVLDPNGQLQPIQAVDEWGLLSEPWIFVVDAAGVVRGSFEGVVGEDELRAAIAAVTAG